MEQPLTTVVRDDPSATIDVKIGYAPPGEDFVAIEKTRAALGVRPGQYVTLLMPSGVLAKRVRRAPRELSDQIKDREGHYLFMPQGLMESQGLPFGMALHARASLPDEIPASTPVLSPTEVLAAGKTLAAHLREHSERMVVGLGREENRDVLYVYTNGADEVASSRVPTEWQGVPIIKRLTASMTPALSVAEMNPPPRPAPVPRDPADEGEEAGRRVGRRDPSLVPYATPAPPTAGLPVVEETDREEENYEVASPEDVHEDEEV